MRTYVIEPQTVFTPYLERILAAAGLDVIAAHTEVDPKDLGTHAPDAVFVDLDYFGFGGPTAICRIRETLRAAIVIALSNSSDPMFTATCIVAGANVMCQKTDVEGALVRSLRNALATVHAPS